MTKKEKVVDLKTKAEKFSEDHLQKTQSIVTAINKINFDIGVLEGQKHGLLHALFQANDKLKDMQDIFIKEYGTADINIQDGTIMNKDEQTDKKD